MEMGQSTNVSNILGFGNLDLFKSLINKINNEFKTNETYKNSLNQIEIVQTNATDSCMFKIKINTKYYDLDLNLELISTDLDENDLKLKLDKYLSNRDDLVKSSIQGILILVDKEKFDFVSSNLFESVLNKNNENDDSSSCLNILILNEFDKLINEKVELFLDKYEDFVSIKLNLNEDTKEEQDDEFSGLDELINSFLVHSWTDMILKSDKKSQKSEQGEENNESEDENGLNEADFNFENLLMNLKEIREKATNLSFDERKKYAEEVAINFWKSIGGDSEELGDLDKDDE